MELFIELLCDYAITIKGMAMNTLKAIEDRRSVRRYKEDFVVPEEDFRAIMNHTLLSPTSFNIQNWRFIRVTDPEIRQKVEVAALNQIQVQEASEVLILCGDMDAWKQEPTKYLDFAPEESREYLLGAMREFYEGNIQKQRDECIRSCGMAAQTLMLAAKSMGYDTNPMLGYNYSELANIIDLPDGHVIAMMIVLGKAKEPARERGFKVSLDDVLFENSFTKVEEVAA